MKENFEDLVNLIGEQELWVTLRTDIKICLVDVLDYKNKIFIGKYTPCVPKTKAFPVKYEKIKCIAGGK